MASEDIPGNDPWWFRHPLREWQPPMTETSKSELRAHFRKARADFVENLSDQERAIAFGTPPTMLSQLFAAGKIVAGYIPVGSEADPRKLLTAAQNAGCSIALPYVTSKASPMKFLRWSFDEPLFPGPFGLMQPHPDNAQFQPDVILTPLVAFDRHLMRLGQGAGHYDRALSIANTAVKVGIAWSVQEAEELPTDPWDIPLDAILTEKAWISQ
jgi:5-formyltetrahydrofolate cyclo-ligase